MSELPIKLPEETSIFDESGQIISSGRLHNDLPVAANSHYVRTPDNDNRLPFLVVTPHAGIFTPKGFEQILAEDLKLLDVIQRGDVYTDHLTINAPEIGATQIISLVAPSYLNVGRAVTSINPADVRNGLKTLPYNPNDKYVGKGEGQGLVAVKSLYGNKDIYDASHVPDESEISNRIRRFYNPFHQELEQAVQGNLDRYNYSLLFDIHSCPSIGAPKDPDSGQERADIIFSNNDGLSCPSELMEIVVRLAEEFGYSVTVNTPYKGGFNTQKYAAKTTAAYQDYDFGSRGSESLQIEYNRKSMGLDEQALVITDLEKFAKMQDFTNRLMQEMAKHVRLSLDS